MREYLPLLIVCAIIGVFTVFFLVAYALEKNKKESMGFDRHNPTARSSAVCCPMQSPTGRSLP